MAIFNPPKTTIKMAEEKRSNLAILPMSDIFPDPQNDHVYEVDEELDQALEKSIRENGVLQPLLLRPHPNLPSKFMIVAGHRRYRAAKAVKRQTVPVMVLNATEDKSDTIRSKIQFIETNTLTRSTTVQERLAMIIELEASYQLMRNEDESIRGIPTRELIAQSMGMSERQIADYMTVKNGLPDNDWKDWYDNKISLNEALKRVNASKSDKNEDVLIGKEEPRASNPILVLMNDGERRSFLDSWPSWKIRCRAPKLNLVVREYVLPDESRILSFDFGMHPRENRKGEYRLEHKHLLKNDNPVSFHQTCTAVLINHLRDVVPGKDGGAYGTS